MVLREFGQTGMAVSPIGFGTMELELIGSEDSKRLLDQALDGGVNYVDTAPCYPESEKILGEAISGRRNEYHLATKCGCTGPYADHPHRFDRQTLLDNIDSSLRLLKTDHVDLWQLHMQSSEVFPGGTEGEIVQTMREVKKLGKAAHIGLSFKNSGPDDPLYPAEHGLNSMRRFGTLAPFESVQLVYGAMTRTSENAIRSVAATGRAVIARGLLKKYTPTYDAYAMASGLLDLCDPGESLQQFLIRFGLSVEGVTMGLVGTLSASHLQADIDAARKGVLQPDVLSEAKRRLDAIGIRPTAF